MAMKQPEYCFEVMNGLHKDMSSLNSKQGYWLVGGIMTSALIHQETIIDHQAKTIIAPMEASPTITRDNGTRRDIDIVIPEVIDNATALAVRQAIEQSTDRQLIASVFGFEYKRPMTGQDRLNATLFEWTSKRRIDDQGKYYYELFPLSKEVPPESYEPWQLQLPSGSIVTTINPTGILLAYMTRSISGIRHKDKTKLDRLENRIKCDPILKEQLAAGSFTTWREFADDINTLGQIRGAIPDSTIATATPNDLRVFYFKARLLRFVERFDPLIKIAHSQLGSKILRHFNGDA